MTTITKTAGIILLMYIGFTNGNIGFFGWTVAIIFFVLMISPFSNKVNRPVKYNYEPKKARNVSPEEYRRRVIANLGGIIVSKTDDRYQTALNTQTANQLAIERRSKFFIIDGE
jgi:hypothetical protein